MSEEKQNELLINDIESNNSEVMSNKQIEEVTVCCDRCGKSWNGDIYEPLIMLAFYDHKTHSTIKGKICGDCESVFWNLTKIFLSGTGCSSVDKKPLSYDAFLMELGNTGGILEKDLQALYSAYIDDSATE